MQEGSPTSFNPLGSVADVFETERSPVHLLSTAVARRGRSDKNEHL